MTLQIRRRRGAALLLSAGIALSSVALVPSAASARPARPHGSALCPTPFKCPTPKQPLASTSSSQVIGALQHFSKFNNGMLNFVVKLMSAIGSGIPDSDATSKLPALDKIRSELSAGRALDLSALIKRLRKVVLRPELASYLTKPQADARYLGKLDTAADSAKLGGVPVSGFVQGAGKIFTGRQELADNAAATTLVSQSNGNVGIKVSTPGGTPTVEIANGAAAPLEYVDGGVVKIVPANGTSVLTLTVPAEKQIQVFYPDIANAAIITITITGVPAGAGQTLFIGQMQLGTP